MAGTSQHRFVLAGKAKCDSPIGETSFSSVGGPACEFLFRPLTCVCDSRNLAAWPSPANDLPDILADAIEAKLPHREDRDLEAQLFAGCNSDALRTAIGRACKAAGVPVFSPHDLRHRRISVLHKQGRTWAEIGGFVGQRKLSVTSDVYTHVLADAGEIDYGDVRTSSA